MSQLRNEQLNAPASTTKAGTESTTHFVRVAGAPINIKEFGAVGDGYTDDQSAIASAFSFIQTNNGGILYFPPGTYILGSKVLFTPNNTSLRGEIGTTIIKAANGSDYDYMFDTNVGTGLTIENMEFDANQANRGASVNVKGGIRLNGVTNLVLKSVTARNTLGATGGGHAVGIVVAATRANISHTKVFDCGTPTFPSDGMYLSGEEIHVTDHLATNCTDHGLVFERANNSTAKGITCLDCSGGIGISAFGNVDNFNIVVDDFIVKRVSASYVNIGIDFGTFAPGFGELSNITFSNGFVDTRGNAGSNPAIGSFAGDGEAGILPTAHAITNVSAANPAVITSTGHGLSSGATIEVMNVRGPTAINQRWIVTVINANTFSVPLNTTSLPSYVSNSGVWQTQGRTRNVHLKNIHVLQDNSTSLGTYIANVDYFTMEGCTVNSSDAPPVTVDGYSSNVKLFNNNFISGNAHTVIVNNGTYRSQFNENIINGKDGITIYGIYFFDTSYEIYANGNIVTGSSISSGGIGTQGGTVINSLFVDTVSDQTIGGVKTFTSSTNLSAVNFLSTNSSPTIGQTATAINSATGATLSISGQNATGTSANGGGISIVAGSGTNNGGNLTLESGPGITIPGSIIQKIGNHVILTTVTASGGVITTLDAAQSFKFDQGVSGQGWIANFGTISFWGNLVSFKDFSQSSVFDLTLNGSGASSLGLASATTFSIQQSPKSTDVPAGDFTISTQGAFNSATGTNRTGGNFVISLPNPTNSGTVPSAFKINSSGQQYIQIGQYNVSNTNGAYWAGTTAPSLSNFIVLGDGSSASYFNAPLSGILELSFGGVGASGLELTASLLSSAIPTWSFLNSTNPVITQAAFSGTGSISGHVLTIRSQAGQNQTGSNNNNAGGDVVIAGGAAGTGGSGSAGLPGGVTMNWGDGTQIARAEMSNAGFGIFPFINFGNTGGIRAQNVESIATSGDAYYIASGNVYLGFLTAATAFGFNASSGLTIAASGVVPTISQAAFSGTGANSGTAFTIQTQAGQNQTGVNNNNNGGNLVLNTGVAGTGGSGTAGASGTIIQKLGNQTVLSLSSVNGVGITTLLDATQGFSIFQGNSGQAWYFISGNTIFESTIATFYDLGVNKIFDFNQNGAGASNMTIAAPVTYTFTQAQTTGTGATASKTLTIKAQDAQLQAGANNNNVGGSVMLQAGAEGTGGSGTAGTPGAIQLKLGSHSMGQFSTTAWPDTRYTVDPAAAYFVFAANGTSQSLFFQTIGSGGATYFQTNTINLEDASLSLAMVWSLAATGATQLQAASGVTSLTITFANNTTNSATASSLNLFSQAATGTTAIGGDINIGSGHGTSTNGKVNLAVGGNGGTAPTVLQLQTTDVSLKINSVTLLDMNTGTGVMAFGDNVSTAHVDLFAGSNVRCWTNSVNGFSVSDTLINIGVPTVSYVNTVSSPTLNQSAVTTSNATGQALKIQAQNSTGSGGSTIGGALNLTGGTGNTNGKVQLQDGGTTIAAVGGSTMTMIAGVFVDKIVTQAAATTTTLDMSTGNIQEITMGTNITTLAFTNLKTGAIYTITFLQDVTGSRTLAVPSSLKVVGNTFTLTTGKGSARDSITAYYNGTKLYELARSQNVDT